MRLQPPFKSIGGKFYLASKIAAMIPSTSYYRENFARAFSVGFVVQCGDKIWNDLDPKLYNLMFAIKNHFQEFKTEVEVEYTSNEFEFAKEMDKTPLEHKDTVWGAAMTYIRLNMSRGGLGNDFAWSDRLRGGIPGDINGWKTRLKQLPKLSQELQNIKLTNVCGIKLVQQDQNRKDIFQYLDPPYMPNTRKSKTVYRNFEMTKSEHYRLAYSACNSSGPIMISGYRCDEYDTWYKDWKRVDFTIANHSSQQKLKQNKIESVWFNY